MNVLKLMVDIMLCGRSNGGSTVDDWSWWEIVLLEIVMTYYVGRNSSNGIIYENLSNFYCEYWSFLKGVTFLNNSLSCQYLINSFIITEM